MALSLVSFAYLLAYNGGGDLCRTCFDQIQGCAGGSVYPFVATTAQNGLLLGGVAAATETAIVARVPLRFTRILTRSILGSLLIIGRSPPPGTPVDLSALTNAQLSDPLMTSGVEPTALIDEVTSRLAAANTQMEVSRLNAMTQALLAKQKMGRGAHGAVASGDGTAELVGVYRYFVRCLRTRLLQVASVLPPEPAQPQGDTQAKVVPPGKRCQAQVDGGVRRHPDDVDGASLWLRHRVHLVPFFARSCLTRLLTVL